MTTDRLSRAIADTLDDLAVGRPTDYIDDVLARTARTRQRPAWTFPGRYLTMSAPLKFAMAAVLATSASLGALALLSDTPDGPAQVTCPSPDASPSARPEASPGAPRVGDCEPWIAYEWFSGEEVDGPLRIKAVRPDGTDAHVIVSAGDEAVLHVDWSHDGSRVAFDRWQGEIIDVWTANADGSDAEPLVACEVPCLQLSNPSWSPDDTKLVVQRWDRDDATALERCYLEVIDVASRERTVILEGPDGADGTSVCFAHPRWAPDGSAIVFTKDDWESQGEEWVGTGRSIATIDAAGLPEQEPLLLTDPAMQATHPDWHPREDVIVFGTHDLADFRLATNLYTIRADGTELSQVTDYGDGDVRATFPSWTPDGEQIIFNYVMPVTRDDRGGRSIAFIKSDGTGLRVVPGVNGHEARLRPIP
jgi:Tol biopolymer transport system component